MNAILRQKRSVGLALAGLLLPWRLLAGDIQTQRVVLTAAEAFEQGQGAHGVMLDDSGKVVLYNRVLIEDDGPGQGSDADWLKTDGVPTTAITGDTRVKKTLHIDRPGAYDARLIAPPGVSVELNGHALEIPTNSTSLQIPPSLLREGDNEVILFNKGDKRRTVKIAPMEDILRNAPERKTWPHRSFKSTDAGKTWEPIDGEYMVRLHLTQYLTHGDVISPVIQFGGGLENGAPLLTPVYVQSVELSATVSAPGRGAGGIGVSRGVKPGV